MIITRSDFLTVLQAVKPALVTGSPVEELSHIWFTGETVRAGNDFLGVEVPFKADFKGGVRGPQLIGLLESSGAKDVEVAKNGDELSLKAGRAALKLPLLALTRAVWEFPDVGAEEQFKLDAGFFAILDRLLFSVGGGSAAEQQGIVFTLADDLVELAATDSRSLTWMTVVKPAKFKTARAVVPAEFFNHVSRLCKSGGKFSIMKDFAVAENTAGVCVYSRLVFEPAPVDFHDALVQRLPKKLMDVVVDIPKGLEAAVKRSEVLVFDPKQHALELKVSSQALQLYALTPYGELKETFKLPSHSDVQGRFNPNLISRALMYVTSMVLTADCIVLVGEDKDVPYDQYIYIVAGMVQ